ncbi:MAG: DUF3597 family protein [Methylococcales bacterium]|nr:DUF3597 family protein [Methylococcales bacterium]
MGMFDSMMDTLGMGDEAVEGESVEAVEEEVENVEEVEEVEEEIQDTEEPMTVEAIEVEANSIDIVSKLEELGSANEENLNWKVSIVDLLKLLKLDSSYGSRKELAAELSCPEEKMADSAQMNMWLHSTVLQKLAENGGNIPQELLD